MRAAPSYGVRGRQAAAHSGIRQTARTYGKARIGTYARKAGGAITVDSDAERLASHLLSIDPRVRSFRPQPFTVDLVGARLLLTRDEVREARRLHSGRGPAMYTPDYATVQADGLQRAYEVKLQGYEGDEAYWAKIEQARTIMGAYCYRLLSVVVPADVRHPVLVNAQLLQAAQARIYAYRSEDLIERVEQYCAAGPVLQRDLCADLGLPTGMVPVLLAAGVLQADLARQAICADLVLSAAHGALDHLCLIDALVCDAPGAWGATP